MTLYESPQVQQWRIEYSELREEFGTELSEFEFVARKAAALKKERQEGEFGLVLASTDCISLGEGSHDQNRYKLEWEVQVMCSTGMPPPGVQRMKLGDITITELSDGALWLDKKSEGMQIESVIVEKCIDEIFERYF